MTQTSSITPTTQTHYPTGSAMLDDWQMLSMSPEDIIVFVRRTLSDIDGQLYDYRNKVAERQRKSAELREALSIMAENKNRHGHLRDISEEDYNRLMTLLAKNLDLPEARAAFDVCLGTYGGFTPTEPIQLEGDSTIYGEGTPVPGLADGDNDKMLGANELSGAMDNTRRAMEGLNSDNEMVMLDLKKLSDQRNQATQLASNLLNADHETKKNVLNNIR